MPSNSYTEKLLRATLILADGNSKFQGTGSNTLILQGLRMVAVLQAIQSYSNQMDLQIYGMRPVDMNALTVAFFGINPTLIPQNNVILEANDGNGWVQVFEGILTQAAPEYRSAPDAYFHLQANTGFYSQLYPAKPISSKVSLDLATTVEIIAGQMGFAFENNGVSIQMTDVYYAGTLWDQIASMCFAYQVDFFVERGTVAIAPKGQNRYSASPIILAPTSGLIGYPVIEQGGLTIEALFNPAIVAGTLLTVKDSDLPAANAQWIVNAALHTLETKKPNGLWQSSLQCQQAVPG